MIHMAILACPKCRRTVVVPWDDRKPTVWFSCERCGKVGEMNLWDFELPRHSLYEKDTMDECEIAMRLVYEKLGFDRHDIVREAHRRLTEDVSE